MATSEPTIQKRSLPSWHDLDRRQERGEQLSALEAFIHTEEPGAKMLAERWRSALLAAVNAERADVLKLQDHVGEATLEAARKAGRDAFHREPVRRDMSHTAINAAVDAALKVSGRAKVLTHGDYAMSADFAAERAHAVSLLSFALDAADSGERGELLEIFADYAEGKIAFDEFERRLGEEG